jgi:hypothetical protein
LARYITKRDRSLAMRKLRISSKTSAPSRACSGLSPPETAEWADFDAEGNPVANNILLFLVRSRAASLFEQPGASTNAAPPRQLLGASFWHMSGAAERSNSKDAPTAPQPTAPSLTRADFRSAPRSRESPRAPGSPARAGRRRDRSNRRRRPRRLGALRRSSTARRTRR